MTSLKALQGTFLALLFAVLAVCASCARGAMTGALGALKAHTRRACRNSYRAYAVLAWSVYLAVAPFVLAGRVLSALSQTWSDRRDLFLTRLQWQREYGKR